MELLLIYWCTESALIFPFEPEGTISLPVLFSSPGYADIICMKESLDAVTMEQWASSQSWQILQQDNKPLLLLLQNQPPEFLLFSGFTSLFFFCYACTEERCTGVEMFNLFRKKYNF